MTDPIELTDEQRAQIKAEEERLLAAAKPPAAPFTLLQRKPLGCQVCSSLSIEETTKRLNAEHPCGTEHGWVLTDRPESNPVPCAHYPTTHTHYVYDA